jgi:hypothetical protein
MKRINRAAALAFAVLCGFMVAGCATRAYVGLTPGEGIREVDLDSGALATLRPSHNSQIVGVAYEERTDHLFLRLLPGTQLMEVDRATAQVLRTFSAQQVTAGCGGIFPSVEVPSVNCGLAQRASDRNLFLDHPTGNPVTEITVDGTFVRHIALKTPGGPIGGLGFDQDSGTLFVLYIASRTVAEVDLNGVELRRITPQGPIQPQGLERDSRRNEFHIPLANGNEIGVFSDSGALLRQFPLQRAGVAGGVGSGRRAWWRFISGP